MYGHKFSRWIIITCGLGLIGYALYVKGILQYLFEMDSTFISLGILVAFFMSHFFVLSAIIRYQSSLETKLWYVAESMITVGMIGTVVGFTLLFGDAFATLDVEDSQSIAAVLTDLAVGMGTALVTTLTGLVCSLILKGELVFLVGQHDV